MPLRWITSKEQTKMAVHVLKKRTYLDAKGRATADADEGVSLLGIENDEITQEQAVAAGLMKEVEAAEESAAEMMYYDATGKRVKADSADVAVQFLDNDPNRPDAPQAHAAPVAAAKAEAAAAAPTKAELLARAEELGLDGFTKRSKNADVAKAIAKAEAAAAAPTA